MDDTGSGQPTADTHDRRGRFAKGNNAATENRAKRQRGMSRRIAQETRSGMELVELALEIARERGHRDQLKAIDWLTIRMCGKVPDKLEVSGEDGKPLSPLATYTPEQLLALAKAAPPTEET